MGAKPTQSPRTLVEAVRYFADESVALAFMVNLRWGGMEHVCCPNCGSVRVRFIGTRRVWECRETHPKKRFSIKTGTIMEDSPLPLSAWLVAFWLEANAKNSISSYEVHRALGITQKSAWFMQQRIRLAMSAEPTTKLTGMVEADESYIGGLAHNMHSKRRNRIKASGDDGKVGKTVVMGLLERGGQVRTAVVPNVQKQALHEVVHANVEPGSLILTDSHRPYRSLKPTFAHEFIDHSVRYVNGHIHTNGLENFWALFKRCVKGTHVSLSPWHLQKYLDAEVFRYNERKVKDGDRFVKVAGQIRGKRLTYKALIAAASGWQTPN